MTKQSSLFSKRVVKTQKGYAGDSINVHKQVEQGNLEIAKKKLGNKTRTCEYKKCPHFRGHFYSTRCRCFAILNVLSSFIIFIL